MVDRLSNYVHFMPLKHPFTVESVARVFFDHIFKLHSLPKMIISDRDSIFLSSFWQEIFRLQGVDLRMSTAYHPQTDGQMEIVNKCLKTYLCCMTHDNPNDWSNWLTLAEFWYNTNYHISDGVSSFKALYGQLSLIHLPYFPGDSKVEAVDRSLTAREENLKLLNLKLLKL